MLDKYSCKEYVFSPTDNFRASSGGKPHIVTSQHVAHYSFSSMYCYVVIKYRRAHVEWTVEDIFNLILPRYIR